MLLINNLFSSLNQTIFWLLCSILSPFFFLYRLSTTYLTCFCLFYSTTRGAPNWKLLFYFKTTPEQKKRRAEARRKGLLPEWRGAIRAPLHKNTREGKREAFLRRPIVEPAKPEQGPCVYECSAQAFQERQKILAEEWKPNNPVLKFLPIARKFMSQAELEEAISKRPDSDYRINLS